MNESIHAFTNAKVTDKLESNKSFRLIKNRKISSGYSSTRRKDNNRTHITISHNNTNNNLHG